MPDEVWTSVRKDVYGVTPEWWRGTARDYMTRCVALNEAGYRPLESDASGRTWCRFSRNEGEVRMSFERAWAEVSGI